MKVELLHATPVDVVMKAIRKCYQSEERSDNMGAKDKALILQIIATGHTSTIEHVSYTFDISGVSRGLLQELARHRVASLSVKSTRYTLGKIKSEAPFVNEEGRHRAMNYLVMSNVDWVNYNSVVSLEEVRQGAEAGIPNDQLKYMLPESFKTSLIWTVNARSLRNFLELRLSASAHWEIRNLAKSVLELIPEEHMVLFHGITA